jgi:hypothetical protein
LYDDVGTLLGENTRPRAIDASHEFARQTFPALERAVGHSDMTEELTDMLSTLTVSVLTDRATAPC